MSEWDLTKALRVRECSELKPFNDGDWDLELGSLLNKQEYSGFEPIDNEEWLKNVIPFGECLRNANLIDISVNNE